MKTVTRAITAWLIALALLAPGCSTLGAAPSYVPSPFGGMHGQ